MIIADDAGQTDEVEYQKEIIKDIAEYFIKRNSPKEFTHDDPNNIIVQMDLSFEKLCATMESEGIPNPGKLTLFEFNTRVAFLEKRFEQRQND